MANRFSDAHGGVSYGDAFGLTRRDIWLDTQRLQYFQLDVEGFIGTALENRGVVTDYLDDGHIDAYALDMQPNIANVCAFVMKGATLKHGFALLPGPVRRVDIDVCCNGEITLFHTVEADDQADIIELDHHGWAAVPTNVYVSQFGYPRPHAFMDRMDTLVVQEPLGFPGSPNPDSDSDDDQ